METPTRDTISTLCHIVQEAGFRDDHHNVAQLLGYIEVHRWQLEQVEAALRWVMQDDAVTISMLLGPAIRELSRKAAEASLEESRESTTTKHGG